jgi:MFS transporter, Spinster family, sphingosine-1-phosphate transporter
MQGARVSEGRSGFYPWYVTALLSLAYAVAVVDRQVLNLLVDPIRADLHLTDTQISLLQGLAFAGGYLVMGPPLGRLADRSNRRNLIVGAIVIWSASTVLCGFATGFRSLFYARLGVGIAEAALVPAAWSLLADYFGKGGLSRAMSLFLLGPFIGNGLALILGGLIVKHATAATLFGTLGQQPPWGRAFVLIGLPGLVVAALMLSIREPRRSSSAAGQDQDQDFNLREALAALRSQGAFYTRFFGGMSLLFVVLFGLPAWTPALLTRVHGVGIGQVGLQYGVATLLAGTIGVLLGPTVAGLLEKLQVPGAQLRAIMLLAFLAAIFSALLPFAPNYGSALSVSALASCMANAALPLSGSVLQTATPARLRGLATAIYAFALTLIGVGLAPTLIAVIADRLLADPAKIGVSLGCTCALSALASIPLLLSSLRTRVTPPGGPPRAHSPPQKLRPPLTLPPSGSYEAAPDSSR